MWRSSIVLALSSVAATAHAADKPLFVPTPSWVTAVDVPPPPAASANTPVTVLLSDQQVRFDRGSVTTFMSLLLRIDNAQGLSAGNISLPWRPDVGDLQVHRLALQRGGKVIDVLGSGQTFTVVRREPNLESATLDGVLTANIQPEGLQVGDVIELKTSMVVRDPVLGNHVEGMIGLAGPLPIGRAHLRASWPVTLPLKFRAIGGLPVAKAKREGDQMSIEATLSDMQPYVPPKLAPARYRLGRLVELSDFSAWSDLGALMAPLYAKAGVLPATGSLADEVAKIRAASTDPKARATAALALVQDRVRYVALAMGAGGLVPADATVTWSRRYGDCKAKTALLLAILHALDVAADPVAVSATAGDGIDQRLPAIGVFDHVLVRASIAGTTYWLDGTRMGDTSLDRLAVPYFSWGLPLVPTGATLVRMVPPPLTTPASEIDLSIDATAGLSIPAPVRVTQTVRGDDAIGINAMLGNVAGEARDRTLRDFWKRRYDFIDVDRTRAEFDAAKGVLLLTMEGKARMDWSSGWYETDGLGLAYKADFARDAGPDRDAPFAVAYPSYSRTVETIRLPPGFPSTMALDKVAIDRTVAGVEYRRRGSIENRVFRGEATARSFAPAFSARVPAGAQVALRDIADDTLYIRRPNSYSQTDAELSLPPTGKARSIGDLLDRGFALNNRGRFAEALKEYDAAFALEPKNADVLANRGLVYTWLDDRVAAERDLTAAAAIAPNNPVLLRARALLAERTGDDATAITYYTKALAIDARDGFSLQHRASVNRRSGQSAAALSDIDAAIAVAPSESDLRLTRFNILRAMGRDDEAYRGVKEMAATLTDDSFAQVAAANALVALGHRVEAMRAYDRALAIKPEAFIYLNRAEARTRADADARTADYDAALRLDPTFAPALAAKARIQLDQGKVKEAIATYGAAIASEPEDLRLRALRGAAYFRAGQRADSDRDFTAARALADKGTASDLNNLCWTKAVAGVALESALVDCDAALAKQPKSAAFLDSKALVLLRLGRFDQAIATYDDALSLNPDMAHALYGRSIAYAKKGVPARADADRAAALKRDGEVGDRFAEYGMKP